MHKRLLDPFIGFCFSMLYWESAWDSVIVFGTYIAIFTWFQVHSFNPLIIFSHLALDLTRACLVEFPFMALREMNWTAGTVLCLSGLTHWKHVCRVCQGVSRV